MGNMAKMAVEQNTRTAVYMKLIPKMQVNKYHVINDNSIDGDTVYKLFIYYQR